MKKSVFVAVPIHREWPHDAENFFLKNIQAAQNWRISEISKLYQESLIIKAREKLLKAFLISKADYLFFLDDDICLVEENAIDNLIACDKDIVGGAYICKMPPHNPTFCPFDRSHYPDIRGLKAPFEVEMTGTGCMLIRRDVAAAVAENNKYPFNLIEAEDCLISEDYSFCMRARRIGFSVWIDPKVTLAHLGVYGYGMSDFYNFVEFNKREAENAK